jgi:hypothetical protein
MQLRASPLGLEATPELFAASRDERALPRAQHSWTQPMSEAHEDPQPDRSAGGLERAGADGPLGYAG